MLIISQMINLHLVEIIQGIKQDFESFIEINLHLVEIIQGIKQLTATALPLIYT